MNHPSDSESLNNVLIVGIIGWILKRFVILQMKLYVIMQAELVRENGSVQTEQHEASW